VQNEERSKVKQATWTCGNLPIGFRPVDFPRFISPSAKQCPVFHTIFLLPAGGTRADL
jgi:hypothetical protein